MNTEAAYLSLRHRVDARLGHLYTEHACHLACQPGCHDCCTELTVFPVEYDTILHRLQAKGAQLPPLDPHAACSFLKDGLCSIYEERPLICRTHGPPIAFTDPDSDTASDGKSVSFCPKNFTTANLEQIGFGPDNTLDLDRLNLELWEINERHAGAQGHSPTRRIPLRQIREEI